MGPRSNKLTSCSAFLRVLRDLRGSPRPCDPGGSHQSTLSAPPDFLTAVTSRRSSPLGSLTTLHSLLKTIVARWVVSNAGHSGNRPLTFGLPVRAKLVHAALIRSCSA